ncbi:MAG: DNA mismatch repair protein [Chitinophagaceae bacterium]|nr:DNA mismatch repair protein [Chitinophagaceae bacterium]
MSFTTDKQTIGDLDIFGKKGKPSVYALFNHTCTQGGAKLMEDMFRYPLSDHDVINRRSATIRYIHSLGLSFPLQPESMDAAEKYLDNTDPRSQLMTQNNTLGQKLKDMIGNNIDQQLLVGGITALITILHDLRDFVQKTPENTHSEGAITGIRSVLGRPELQMVFNKQPGKKLSFPELVELDKLFRFTNPIPLTELFHHIYTLDVYMTVARVGASLKMTYATALPKGTDNTIRLTGVFHPFLQHPVANSIEIDRERNIIFLTGANMAGKSTFMKSVGIAVYLSHIGFPVPAEKMEFSICDGILTTINLADNINTGYSHFYAEVLRVKKMAEQIKKGMNVFVIFDELFRGTNVKDAYEATVAITDAITRKRNCLFMVSTHILEAAEVLQQRNSQINFVFLPTQMKEGKPLYTYRLEPGISDDRHGMLIIRNEGILNILQNGIHSRQTNAG